MLYLLYARIFLHHFHILNRVLGVRRQFLELDQLRILLKLTSDYFGGKLLRDTSGDGIQVLSSLLVR